MRVVILLAVAYLPMLVEARRAGSNERARLATGGVEARGDVYGVMRVAYPAAFLLMIVEDVVSGGPSRAGAIAGLAMFVAAKALKWWAIASLGSAWTFRVITVPGEPLVARGPYGLMRHPNYVAVVGELMGFALIAGATTTGPIATILFGILMLKRIAVEERALGLIPDP